MPSSVLLVPMTSSFLSFLTDDLQNQLLLWLDAGGLGKLDTAVCNHSLRASWTALLRALNSTAVDEWGHSYSSLRWVARRGLKITRMLITVRFEAWRMKGDDVLQMDTSALVELGLNG